MANDQNVDEGTVSSPKEPVSEATQDKSTQLLVDFGKKLENLETRFKGIQGEYDKRESDFQKQLAKYEKLIKKGYEPDEARAEVERQSSEENVLQTLQKQIADLAAHVKGNGIAPSASQEVVQAFVDLGLDTKDPAVIIEMQKYKSLDTAVAGAYKYKKSMSQAPAPTSAQSPSAPSAPKGQLSVEELTENYKKDMLAARGKPEQVRALKNKYAQQGVDVHNVSF